MSTMMEFNYHFFGTADEIAIAREAIEELQGQYADRENDGDHYFSEQPKIDIDGALAWWGYTLDELEDFEKKIVEMTAGTSLQCFSYWGTTDGRSESVLNMSLGGEVGGLGHWYADIGIYAAMAIARLKKNANAEELLVLINTFLHMERQGWEEDDFPWLLSAEALVCAITVALALHPGLLSTKAVRKALMSLTKPLKSVREDLKKIARFKLSDLREVDQLKSTIEGLELEADVPVAKPSKRPAMSL